jgi:hypothetical protein
MEYCRRVWQKKVIKNITRDFIEHKRTGFNLKPMSSSTPVRYPCKTRLRVDSKYYRIAKLNLSILNCSSQACVCLPKGKK